MLFFTSWITKPYATALSDNWSESREWMPGTGRMTPSPTSRTRRLTPITETPHSRSSKFPRCSPGMGRCQRRRLGVGLHPLRELLGLGSMGPHPIALAVDVEYESPVEQPVEHCGGHHGVVEDLPPGPDAQVRGEHGRALQVALGDHLEEGGSCLVGQGQVADLVDDQQSGSGEEAHGGGPPSFEGRPVTAGHQVCRRCVIGAIARVDGGPGQGDGQHGLAHPGRPDEQQMAARSKNRSVASSLTSFLSIDGWASKSKSSSRNGEGSEAKRSRLARRRISVAATSTCRILSRKAV